MNTITTYLEAGVELGHASLKVSINETCRTWSNTAAGVGRFLAYLKSLGRPVRVSCRVAGSQSRRLVLACLGNDVPISLLNVCQLRDFMRATGAPAEADPIDAGTIARYAATLNPETLDPACERQARQAPLPLAGELPLPSPPDGRLPDGPS